MKIHEHGYWLNNTTEGHGVDRHLAKALVEFFEKQTPDMYFPDINGTRSVYDFGCGTGFYVKELNKSPLIYCEGLDGNPNTKELCVCDPFYCNVSDLTIPYPAHVGIAGWVLSLEVGEHIPSEYEQIFLDNIAKACLAGAIISWAIPGQGGDGHVNCRLNEYIIHEMQNRGFCFCPKSTELLRNQCAEYPHTGYWFRDTLMVFRKTGIKMGSAKTIEEITPEVEAFFYSDSEGC